MKDVFPGYFKESEEDIKKVWEECVFVFDANIILNLYRYSDSTRKEFFRIFSKLEDRIWLPHRAAEEYLKRRLDVIGQQERTYDDTCKTISGLEDSLENARQHPFVNKEILDKAKAVFKELSDELKENKKVHTCRISQDEIKDAVSQIFSGKVGSPYDEQALKDIVEEGKVRYAQKIPPGFKDGDKHKDSEIFSEQCRKYGDLFVWKQVLDKAKTDKVDVVFVTDDRKEDWWEKFHNKTVGPRPELVEEFWLATEKTFNMYQADRFLVLARENLGESVSEEIVNEVRRVQQGDEIEWKEKARSLNKSRLILRVQGLNDKINHWEYQLSEHYAERDALLSRKGYLTSKGEYLRDRLNKSSELMSHVEKIKIYENSSMVNEEIKEVSKNLETLEPKIAALKEELMELENQLSDCSEMLNDESY